MIGKKIGYIRVSTVDQNPERQLESISLDKKFIEYASGKTISRPQLKLLMDYVRDDDIVYVHSIDRLARNVKNLIELIDQFEKKNVEVIFLKENLHFNGKDNALSKLLLTILGAVAEFEHSLIRERQLEGIIEAKKKCIYKGGKKKLTWTDVQKLKEFIEKRFSVKEIADYFKVSIPTIYLYIKKNNIEIPKRGIVNNL